MYSYLCNTDADADLIKKLLLIINIHKINQLISIKYSKSSLHFKSLLFQTIFKITESNIGY